MCWGPSMGGWGMPFGMFLFPFFFLICIGIMFYLFSRRFPFGCHYNSDIQTNKELIEEVRRLRQEVEALKKK